MTHCISTEERTIAEALPAVDKLPAVRMFANVSVLSLLSLLCSDTYVVQQRTMIWTFFTILVINIGMLLSVILEFQRLPFANDENVCKPGSQL